MPLLSSKTPGEERRYLYYFDLLHTVPISARCRSHGEPQRNRRAMIESGATFDVDVSAVCRDDLVNEQKGEAPRVHGALRAFEEARRFLCGNAGTVVSNDHRELVFFGLESQLDPDGSTRHQA